MHPADEIRGSKSSRLSNKRIVLGVTGSIAAVECVKISRELIRHGAEVIPVMTNSAKKIIHPDALWFSTGNKPIIELSGATEHVSLCGRVKKPADLLLICPCTSNTISKIAHGIDDTSVTTFAATAIGSNVPIAIVPAMHISMYDHKIIESNIKKCKKVGIKFIEPSLVGNKAKIANEEEIIAKTIRLLGRQDLVDKKILIIGGSTAESIDDVRFVSNHSSGKTAIWLSKNAFYRGADVELLYGYSHEVIPNYIKNIRYESLSDLSKLLKKYDLKKYDIIILCAALPDYITKKQKGKISSDEKKLILTMQKTPKIISKLRNLAPKSKIIGFKLEENKTKIQEKAHNLLKKNHLDFVVANTLTGLNKQDNEIWIINRRGKSHHKKADKETLTDFILDTIK
jgi:phosphopantothenoylcysteine decarboxylase/phosphopantothenate--cysteine ligase